MTRDIVTPNTQVNNLIVSRTSAMIVVFWLWFALLPVYGAVQVYKAIPVIDVSQTVDAVSQIIVGVLSVLILALLSPVMAIA